MNVIGHFSINIKNILMIARPYPGSRIEPPPPQKKNVSLAQKDVLKMHKFSFEFLICSYGVLIASPLPQQNPGYILEW